MRQGSPTQNDGKKKDGDRKDQPTAQEARLARGQVKSQATLAHEPFVITGQDKVLSPPATGWLPSAKCLGGVGRVTGTMCEVKVRIRSGGDFSFSSDHCSPRSSHTSLPSTSRAPCFSPYPVEIRP